jgi:hypothetical protein
MVKIQNGTALTNMILCSLGGENIYDGLLGCNALWICLSVGTNFSEEHATFVFINQETIINEN